MPVYDTHFALDFLFQKLTQKHEARVLVGEDKFVSVTFFVVNETCLDLSELALFRDGDVNSDDPSFDFE